jgi:hypothetical protein
MASGLLVLLDDIAMILDDVAAIAKVAVKRTAGILGDDLALKVEQLVGISILVAIESLKYFYSKWASKCVHSLGADSNFCVRCERSFQNPNSNPYATALS